MRTIALALILLVACGTPEEEKKKQEAAEKERVSPPNNITGEFAMPMAIAHQHAISCKEDFGGRFFCGFKSRQEDSVIQEIKVLDDQGGQVLVDGKMVFIAISRQKIKLVKIEVTSLSNGKRTVEIPSITIEP